MQKKSFGLAVLLFLLFGSSSTLAQNAIVLDDMKNYTRNEHFMIDTNNTGLTDLTQAYDGWAADYRGTRSEIFFDPEDNINDVNFDSGRWVNRALPHLNRGTTALLDLTVDEEVPKAAFWEMQSLRDVSSDARGDALANIHHLNLFSSQLGIAILTLHYLDKTVAAGLAAAQQQEHQRMTHTLLDNIRFTNAKIANPEKELIYKDADELFQACIMTNGWQDQGIIGGNHPLRKYSTGASENQGNPEDICNARGCSSYFLPGTINYCACCAEETMEVYGSACDSDGNEQCRELYSLVERVFAGRRYPNIHWRQQGSAHEQAYISFVKQFITFYGDIVTISDDGSNDEYATTITRYNPPLFDVSQIIFLLRNKDWVWSNLHNLEYANEQSELAQWDDHTFDQVHYGICPAFYWLLDHFINNTAQDARQDDREEWERYWVEAGFGAKITAADFMNVVKMGPGRRRDNWVEVFCDTSAVNAFKRIHYRMKSYALNFMALNMKATDREKALIKTLMGRVDSYLALGFADANSSATRPLVALGIETDRREQAERAATWSAAMAAQESIAQTGDNISFGGDANPQ